MALLEEHMSTKWLDILFPTAFRRVSPSLAAQEDVTLFSDWTNRGTVVVIAISLAIAIRTTEWV
jgi:hypothetical protein